MEPGSLEVVVYRGKELSGKKPDELPTTSVEIKLGKEAVGTRVVENNRNPQWNTMHKFTNVDISDSKSTLELTLRDKKDKFVGRIQIPLGKTLDPEKNYRIEKWYPILNKKMEQDSSITGEIQIKLRFFSAQEERDKEKAKAQAKDKAYEEQAKNRDTLMEGKKPKSAAPKKNPFGDQYGTDSHLDEMAEKQIQEIVNKTENVRGESKASTTRTLQMLGEAQEIAAVSSEKLAHQGDQLNRIADDSYKIEDNMKASARQIRGIKSIFGAAANFFTRSPSPSRRRPKKSSSKHQEEENPSKKRGSHQSFEPAAAQEEAKTYPEDDVDRDLDQISFGVNNLKNIAEEMGREINSQAVTIDKLIDQTEKNDGLIFKYGNKIRR